MASIYNMADAWNNSGTVFTAIKMNVTDTASDATSLLMDLQVGTVSQLSVSKSGRLNTQLIAINKVNPTYRFEMNDSSTATSSQQNAGLILYDASPASASSAEYIALQVLTRHTTANATSSHVIGVYGYALSQSAQNNQTYGVYGLGEYSGTVGASVGSIYGGVFEGRVSNASGTAGDVLGVKINPMTIAGTSSNIFGVYIANTNVAGAAAGGSLHITGNSSAKTGITFSGLNSESTNQSARIYSPSAGNISLTGALAVSSSITSNGFGFTSKSTMLSPSDGVVELTNNAGTDFSRLQLGGTTSSFPALKRSSAVVQARLADDSAFAQIQGRLTTDVNATTGLTAGVLSATTNASIVLYDALGQAYRIPCII